MDLDSLMTRQQIIKRVTRELGNAYANKFAREDSREVYFDSVHKIVHLFPDANQALVPNRVACCIGGRTVFTTPEQCQLLGTPGPCDEHPPKPDLNIGQRYLRLAAYLIGDAYADKLESTALQKPDQLEKVYNDSIQKVGELFKDANKGLDGSLIECRSPHGPSVPGLTEQQCKQIGGDIIQ
jgi:hypothetical protein